MTVQRNKTKFSRTIEAPIVEKSDPLRGLSNEELFKIIGEKNSLARALAESYNLSKVVIECKKTAEKAKMILKGRRVKIPEHL